MVGRNTMTNKLPIKSKCKHHVRLYEKINTELVAYSSGTM